MTYNQTSLKMPLLKRVHYLDTKKGYPLVLVHGFLGSNDLWKYQIKEFRKKFRVIGIELPGYGKNVKAKPLSSIHGYVNYVLKILNSLKIKEFYLIGHSMGGMIAQEIAARSKKIKKVILHATGPIGEMPERFEPLKVSRMKLRKNGIKKQGKFIASTWFVKGAKHKNFNICKRSYERVLLKTADLSMLAMQKWNGKKNLKKIKIPTLITWGNKDKSYGRPQVNTLKKQIKNSRLKVFNNCAHNVHLEKVKDFNRSVLKFLGY
jgi:2-hydroxy-6-oxonona-2,4-dienedioate hydrolase